MMQRTHPIEMIERIVDFLALLTDERLHKSAVILHADHGRDVALQFGHFARSPGREIAERHFVALADDVIQFVEHLEIDVVDLLHLSFQHLWLHHRVEQHLVGALDGRQHVHALHQVGHTHIIVALGLLLAGLEQLFVQQIMGMVGVKLNIIGIVGVGMNPYRVFAALKHAAQYGCQRPRAQLGVGHRQHVSLQATVRHIPVEVVGTPLRVKPFLVKTLRGWWHGHVGMRFYPGLKMLPHVDDDALVVPPVDISLFCFFKIFFPHNLHCFVVK